MSLENPQFWRTVQSPAPVHSGVFLFICIVIADASSTPQELRASSTAPNLPVLFRIKSSAADPLHCVFPFIIRPAVLFHTTKIPFSQSTVV
jgi:hypothetical protein